MTPAVPWVSLVYLCQLVTLGGRHPRVRGARVRSAWGARAKRIRPSVVTHAIAIIDAHPSSRIAVTVHTSSVSPEAAAFPLLSLQVLLELPDRA